MIREHPSCETGVSTANLLATIWLTNFVGIREKPGLTTKYWWRTGAGRDGAKVENNDQGAHAVVEHMGNDECTRRGFAA